MLKLLYERFSYPLGVEKPSLELKEAIKTLGWDIGAWQVISASTWIMALSFAIISPIFALLILDGKFILAIALTMLPLLIYYILTEYPKYLADTVIAAEIGEIPILVSSLVVFLKNNPNVEVALEHISNFEGKLFSRLKSLFMELKIEGRGTGSDVLINLSERYYRQFPEFKRSILLILEGEYDRGLKICMEGIKNRIESFVNSLNIPTMIIFSVGAVLPLVFISLLPSMALINVDFWILLVSILISSIFIYLYSNLTLSKRPIVFPNPIVYTRKRDNLLWYLLIFSVISVPSWLYILNLFGFRVLILPKGYNLIWLILALTLTISIYAYRQSKELIEYRNYMNSLELEAPSISYNLASLAMEGKPIDMSLKEIDFSASPRLQMLGRLIRNAINKGSERLYELLTSFGDYFSNIDSIKKSFFNRIDNVITMMKLTAVIFLPLVAAISVSVSKEISFQAANLPFFKFSLDVDLIVFIAGLYTLLTSLLLIRYITYLKNGPDTVEFMNSIYRNLPFSIGLFILAYSVIPGVI